MPQDPAARYEAWLTRFQEGEEKPTWMEPAVKPLEGMLRAASADERLASALCLVALGGPPAASEALAKLVKERPDLVGDLAQSLPFRHWPDRLDFFKVLMAAEPGPDTRAELIERMAEILDSRLADLLWSLTAREQLGAMESYNLMQAFPKLLYGPNVQDPKALPKETRQRILSELWPKAESGPEWQRVFGLVLLASVEPAEAVAIARGIVADEGAPPSLRANGYQILLASLPRDEGRPIALAALGSEDPAGRKVAILALIGDTQRLQALREYLTLPSNLPGLQQSTTSNRPTRYVLERILTEDRLRPLLRDAEPETVALVGYVLALKGDGSGLDRLLAFWRTTDLKNAIWNQRASQAIAALDDDSRVPVLEQIYASERAEMADTPYPSTVSINEFYWTIRSMTGPNARKLRKRIRAEVGMKSLIQGIGANAEGLR